MYIKMNELRLSDLQRQYLFFHIENRQYGIAKEFLNYLRCLPFFLTDSCGFRIDFNGIEAHKDSRGRE